MRPGFLVLLVLLALSLPGMAAALDYRSVAEAAVLYDAPSAKAKPLFVIAGGTPVEVVVMLDAWVKVRDMQGGLAWIERRLLTDKRTLQVRAGGAQIRSAPDEGASLSFEAEADVLLDFVEPGPAGWVRVRHRDGQQGFVRVGQVWGL